MHITSIALKNIKSHRDRKLYFVKGINVLSGANGVGKSTIFEAIGYALFGVDARDFVGNIDRFISIGAKKGEIAVTFMADDGNMYKVSRGVGAGSKWLLAKEIGSTLEVEDHANAQETETRIKELLGLDNGRSLADQFKHVIGPFQNDFLGPFVIRQPTRRQDAFDEILGIDAWRKTYKGTSSLLTAIKSKIEILSTEIGEKQEQVAELSDKEAELKEVIQTQKARQVELLSQQKVLTEISGQVEQFDRQKEKLDTVRNELKQTESSISSGKEYIASQVVLVKQSEEAVKLVQKNRPGKEAFEKADALLHTLRQKEKQRRIIEKDLIEKEKNVVLLAGKLDHETREINKTEQELNVEEKRIDEDRKQVEADPELTKTAGKLSELRKKLEEGQAARALLEGRKQNLLEGRDKLGEGTCPFFQEPCLNISGKEPLDVFTVRLEKFASDIELLDRKITTISQGVTRSEKARKELDMLQERARGLEKQALVLVERRQKMNKRIKNLGQFKTEKTLAEKMLTSRKKELEPFSTLDEDIRQAQQEKQKHQQARDGFTKNQQAAEALPQHSETLKKYKERLAEHEQKREALGKKLQQLREEYKPENHEQARKQKEDLLSSVAKFKEQIENLGKEQRRLKNEINKLNIIQKEIELRSAEKKTFEKKKDLVTFLRNQVFKHVSAQLSERFREEITLRADRIYRTISESDEELYWGDKYQIVLRDMEAQTIRERTDDQLSGGQMMSAVVALRLALLQTIGARIAFFDEPTSNLDAVRRENLAHAFRAIDIGREEVTDHWYDQLFLISHDVAFTEVTDQIIPLDESLS